VAKLRAGIIGLGVMGQNHARVLGSLEGVELVGIVDPLFSDQKNTSWAPVFPDINELLDLKPDYCLIAVPTALHEQIGTQMAENGIHSLIEKPLAHNFKSAQTLVHVFKQAGLIAAVGHIERFNPALQEAKKRIIRGELGEIYQIVTIRQGPFPQRVADVGVVKDLATHDIDLTSWITGKSFKHVSARTITRSGRNHEDLVDIVGELENGIITNHIVNWLTPYKERRTIILGEKGSFIADTLTADLTYYENGIVLSEWEDLSNFRGVTEGEVVRFRFSKPEPLRVEHENFRDAVLGKEVDIATLEQGLFTVKIAEAVIESANSGLTVTIK
jgi:predicted dehydrogenase